MIPLRIERPQIAERIRPPPRAMLRGVGGEFFRANEHQERRFLEGGQIGVDHLLTIFRSWHLAELGTRHVPLAPPADRAKINVIQIGVTVVALAELLD